MAGWIAVRAHSWLVDSNSLRRELVSSECEEESARLLLMVSGGPDRDFDARPSWMNDSENESLSVVDFYSNQRWIWMCAFRCGWVGDLGGGCSGGDSPPERSYGHRSKRGAMKRRETRQRER